MLTIIAAILCLFTAMGAAAGMEDVDQQDARKEAAGSRSPDLNALVKVLGSDAVPAKKKAASQQLVEAGKVAIPVLIGALHDPRVYERRDVANRMNLPGFEPAPKPQIATITVGAHCLDLLYEVITPIASSIDSNFKPFSGQKLQVDDWDGWWTANQGKSLDAIHAELKPLVDEYWKRHGTTQSVKSAGDPSEWEQGFPIPKGALINRSLGGATSKVYEVAAGLDTIAAFYARHLPGTKRSFDAGGMKFSGDGGSVRLSHSSSGTRIALTLPPR